MARYLLPPYQNTFKFFDIMEITKNKTVEPQSEIPVKKQNAISLLSDLLESWVDETNLGAREAKYLLRAQMLLNKIVRENEKNT